MKAPRVRAGAGLTLALSVAKHGPPGCAAFFQAPATPKKTPKTLGSTQTPCSTHKRVEVFKRKDIRETHPPTLLLPYSLERLRGICPPTRQKPGSTGGVGAGVAPGVSGVPHLPPTPTQALLEASAALDSLELAKAQAVSPEERAALEATEAALWAEYDRLSAQLARRELSEVNAALDSLESYLEVCGPEDRVTAPHDLARLELTAAQLEARRAVLTRQLAALGGEA